MDAERLNALRAENRKRSDYAVECQLLQLRAEAFRDTQLLKSQQPAYVAEPDGEHYGLPEVTVDEFDVSTLRRALAKHGALLVRGLLNPSAAEFMRGVIDRAFEADADACAGVAETEETRPWYQPFDAVYGGDKTREFIRTCNAMLAVDSPRGFFHLLEMYYDLKLDQVLTEYFGERPALSAEKTVLRRAVTWDKSGDWHQDGTFLGPSIRSVNVWLTLSDCGVDAPSLEIVPRRLHRLLATTSSYVTSHDVVNQEFPDAMIRPEFKAGDALLFDHFLLHRTWFTPEMSQVRYALESWFFAPSAFPGHYAGLSV